MILTTLRPSYLPTLEFFWKAAQCDVVILTDHLQYTKRSDISISAPISDQGLKLTIPVQHDKQRLPVYQKKISRSGNWQTKHLRNIYHNFHHHPFFEYYQTELNQLYNEEHSLIHFLAGFLIKLFHFFHLEAQVYRASQFVKADDPAQFVVQSCNKAACTTYMADPLVFEEGWLDKDVLHTAGVHVSLFHPLPQAHIFQSYKNLSALNFLFQFGPEAGYLIRQFLPQQ